MKLYLTKTPRIIMRFLSNYTWRFHSKKKEIYLTFDDGPTPEITSWVLSELKKYNAKATFFCIGKNVVQYPKIYNQILKDKHSVGNHTHNHFNGLKHSTKTYIENCIEARKFINSHLFRPPYGKLKPQQAKKIRSLGYKIILWDVLSADFDTRISKETCLHNVLKNTENGSIIVFHDSVKASEKIRFVLPKILAKFSEEGYIFKAIPQSTNN